jgi:hypothetical protein
VILSQNFFRKEWPQKELDGLTARDDGKSKIILPIWYKITAADVKHYSPILADKLSVYYSGSTKGVIRKILRAIYRDRAAQSGWTPRMIKTENGIEWVILPVRPRYGRVICIGRFPVTNREYINFAKETRHPDPIGEKFEAGIWKGPFLPWDDPDYAAPEQPVTCVNFLDALAYSRWLNTNTKDVFVPSALLWDFAATGFQSALSLAKIPHVVPQETIHHQTSSPASIDHTGVRDNSLGVSDMFGNVWEWCGANMYVQASRLSILAGPRSFELDPELRGGSFLDNLDVVYPYLRSNILEDRFRTRHTDLGFRVAASLPLSEMPNEAVTLLEDQPPLAEEYWHISRFPDYLDYDIFDEDETET